MGFAGMSYDGDKIKIEPHLPEKITEIDFCAIDGGVYKRYKVTKNNVTEEVL
jgi:trehalose/maltose hydrolase-like predicted phosphorylase